MIMYMEREELAGPDYHPSSPDIQKWASQKGSVFIGNQKFEVQYPGLRGPKGEIQLNSYQALKRRETFSEELLMKAIAGLSGRKYNEVLTNTAGAFGVSPSSVSRHIVEATTKQLKEFSERKFIDFDLIALFLDTVYRGGSAFIVAVGVDINGKKKALGFWEGATENNEICKELLNDIEKQYIHNGSSNYLVHTDVWLYLKRLLEFTTKFLDRTRASIYTPAMLKMFMRGWPGVISPNSGSVRNSL